VSPVRYELCSYIPEDGILRSHRREKPQNLHSINRLGSGAETNVSSVRYELCSYIPEDGILLIFIHSKKESPVIEILHITHEIYDVKSFSVEDCLGQAQYSGKMDRCSTEMSTRTVRPTGARNILKVLGNFLYI
jgi:hypothetical protein